MDSIIHNRREIYRFIFKKLSRTLFDKDIRNSRNFRLWWRTPMNYVRLMELPITLDFLEVEKANNILDISSPKLLALYLMSVSSAKVTVSDIHDYFTDDFQLYKNKFCYDAHISLIDGRKIPYKNECFDRIYSISVLEHIPGSGDHQAVREIGRVLKKNGIAVLTLPAWTHHLEEWQKEAKFYWANASISKKDNRTFYQRRYCHQTMLKLVESSKLELENFIYIAEHPIHKPMMGDNGIIRHNFHYVEDTKLIKYARFLENLTKLPFCRYRAYRIFSQRNHYITTDYNDQNIRQVAVKLRKN